MRPPPPTSPQLPASSEPRDLTSGWPPGVTWTCFTKLGFFLRNTRLRSGSNPSRPDARQASKGAGYRGRDVEVAVVALLSLLKPEGGPGGRGVDGGVASLGRLPGTLLCDSERLSGARSTSGSCSAATSPSTLVRAHARRHTHHTHPPHASRLPAPPCRAVWTMFIRVEKAGDSWQGRGLASLCSLGPAPTRGGRINP